MKATYTLYLDDMMAFQQYHLSNSKFFLKSKLSSIAIFIIFYSIIYLINPELLSDLLSLYFIIFGGLIGTIILYLKHDEKILKKIRKNFEKENINSTFGIFNIILNADNFIITHNGNESKILWSSLVKIEEITDYIYLYQTTTCAIILPKNKFSDIEGGTLSDFLEDIRINSKKS